MWFLLSAFRSVSCFGSSELTLSVQTSTTLRHFRGRLVAKAFVCALPTALCPFPKNYSFVLPSNANARQRAHRQAVDHDHSIFALFVRHPLSLIHHFYHFSLVNAHSETIFDLLYVLCSLGFLQHALVAHRGEPRFDHVLRSCGFNSDEFFSFWPRMYRDWQTPDVPLPTPPWYHATCWCPLFTRQTRQTTDTFSIPLHTRSLGNSLFRAKTSSSSKPRTQTWAFINRSTPNTSLMT